MNVLAMLERRADEQFNLIEQLLLCHLQPRTRGNIALLYEQDAISYGELACAVARTREYLRAESIGRGDRVGIMLPDTPAFVFLFLASVSLGAIPVPIHPRHNPDDALAMLRHVGARVCFVDAAAELRQEASGVVTHAVSPTLSDIVGELTAAEPGRFVPEPTVAGDCLYLLFSSGTTGRPKAIPRRHSDVLWTAAAFAEDVLQIQASDRVLAVPKLTFGYSLVGNLLHSLLYGASSILIPNPSTAPVMLEAIERHRPTIFLAQPRMLAEFTELIRDPALLHCLRKVVSAGDTLSDPVRQRWQARTGLYVADGFGSTEVGHIFLSSAATQDAAEGARLPVRDCELRVIDEAGAAVPDGTVGRLCIRSPGLSRSYWNDPERTARQFDGGWFTSDDLFVKLDAAYFFAGRRDDMIKTGCGEWVAPGKLEALLLREGAVSDCAIVGVHDERDVVCIRAYVVRGSSEESDAGLSKRLQRLAEQAWPGLDFMRIHSVEMIDSIPRSVNGKVQRHLLGARTLTDFAYQC
jgi:acyl-coenzyme A synthetase/AMP-(fatty) acid ligase